MSAKKLLRIVVLLCVAGVVVSPARALDVEHYNRANAAIEKGIAFLRGTQGDNGSWSPKPGPAITAMAVQAMLDRSDIGPGDPAVAKGIAYILSHQKPDGGIHAGLLENYNTAICLSALSKVDTRSDVAEAISKAQDYLRNLQWSTQGLPDGGAVGEGHAFYGGAGYGNNGRPDISNTQVMLQGLYDSGLSCEDPAFQRAIVFISRCQGVPGNEMFKDQIVQDGGFIYATSIDKDHVGIPQSAASPEMADEGKAGRPVSGLRTYGSMTYAGFKSYLYAELDREDPRVVAAFGWIRKNYTLDRNPGMPESIDQQGLYYYYVTFARALRAWGSTTIDAEGQGSRDWANDLIDALVQRQKEDGSWANEADRWMEGNPDLVTGYALLALQEAVR